MLLACWLEFKFNKMSITLCCFILQPKDIPLVGGCTEPDIESPPTLWQADDCAIFVFKQNSQTRFICTDYNAVFGTVTNSNMFSNVIMFHLYCSYTSEKQYCGSTACLYRSFQRKLVWINKYSRNFQKHSRFFCQKGPMRSWIQIRFCRLKIR
jgi:hypothetical protein